MAWRDAVLSRRAALAMVGLALAGPARAQDPGVATVQLETEAGAVAASVAEPAGAGPFPIVLVAEGGAGLDGTVQDALGRLAGAGFLAIAPVLFAGDPADAALMGRLDAASAWAAAHGGDARRVAIVGFGPGGRAAWLYDAHSTSLRAAVAWSGPMEGGATAARPLSALDAAGRLHAPLLGLYGKRGGPPQRVLLEAESRAKAAGSVAEMVSYVDAGPEFWAVGASPSAAALDAWTRCLAWLQRHGQP